MASSRIRSRSRGIEFLALPQAEDVSDFHCVTTWSRFDNHWRRRALQDDRGTRRAEGDAHVRPVHRLRLHAGHATFPTRRTCRSTRAIEDDVLLVHTWEGKPLPREHGGPCRMITPKLYAWKGAKWIRKIEFLAERSQRLLGSPRLLELGRPWFNDRYADS